MTRSGAAWAGVVALLSGCVYYNAIYNAEQLWLEAERHRVEGRDTLARATYDDVVRTAARGFRAEPEGPWADDALFLLGRARFRLGELRAAATALDDARERADSDEIRLGAGAFLGAVRVAAGDGPGGRRLLDAALADLPPGPSAAEAHYWRARVLLAEGSDDAGWTDLDLAARADGRLAVPAALERVAAAVRLDDEGRAVEGVSRVLAEPRAGARLDTLRVLLMGAGERWGWPRAVALLGRVEDAAWGRVERGRARLVRAEIRELAGDTAGARADADAVARGIGAAAAEARLLLARWRLADARDLRDAQAAVPILLPSGDDPEVAELLADLGVLADLAELGLDEPLGWFGAAEVARDRLRAPRLARGLFLAYADAAPGEPWSAKALLAALDVSAEEGDRAWLRGRLEGRADSPYVLAARGASAPGFEALEEELARRLQEMRNR